LVYEKDYESQLLHLVGEKVSCGSRNFFAAHFKDQAMDKAESGGHCQWSISGLASL